MSKDCRPANVVTSFPLGDDSKPFFRGRCEHMSTISSLRSSPERGAVLILPAEFESISAFDSGHHGSTNGESWAQQVFAQEAVRSRQLKSGSFADQLRKRYNEKRPLSGSTKSSEGRPKDSTAPRNSGTAAEAKASHRAARHTPSSNFPGAKINLRPQVPQHQQPKGGERSSESSALSAEAVFAMQLTEHLLQLDISENHSKSII